MYWKRFARNAVLVCALIALVLWRRAHHNFFNGMTADGIVAAVGGIIILGVAGAALVALAELLVARRRDRLE